MKNKNKIVIMVVCLIVFVAVFGISYYFIFHSSNDKNTPSATSQISNDVGTTATKYVYEDITFDVITTRRDSLPYSSRLDIYQNYKLIMTQDGIGDIFPLGSPCPWDDTIKNCGSSDPAFGVDIIGNGKKYFVFVDVGDGSASPANYYIYELSKNGTITKMTEIDTYGGAVFKDLTGNGHLDVEIRETAFNCWSSACAFSHSPNFILSWNSSQKNYIINTNLMHKNAPTQNTIQQKADFYKGDNWCISDSDGSETCSVPWGYALDLIYSGNAVSAKSYLNLVWSVASSTLEHGEHGSFSSEKDLENKILSNLKSSQYYTAILSLNGGKIF